MEAPTRRDLLVVSLAAGAAVGLGPFARAAVASDDVLIPAGPCSLGITRRQAAELASRWGYHPAWLALEVPLREVHVGAFRIDRFPVTNRRYASFCRATGYPVPEGWVGGAPVPGTFEHPVVQVDRDDARAFAAWDGGRLPTVIEWEKAARGSDARLFPWGDVFEPDACNHDRGALQPPTGLSRVDAHPSGASPHGVLDLIGNAAEWCEDGPSWNCAHIKGGSWLTASVLDLRCSARGQSGAENNRLAYVGFRCAREA